MQIALVGSAPASSRGAPYADSNWQIWGCSPGLYGVAPRVTEWFEMHLWEPGQPWFSPEYCQWLAALPGRGVTLWTGREIRDLPGASVYPYEEILAEFDPNRFFCSSSLFWMMARAIKIGATKIGFWGVDMAAGEEYEMQRAGIHYLTYIARARGIEVGIPPESDLFTPRFAYAVDEWTHSYRKIRARRQELEGRKAQAAQMVAEAQKGVTFLDGALDDLKYMGDTWADKSSHLGPVAAPGFSHEHRISPPAAIAAPTVPRKEDHVRPRQPQRRGSSDPGKSGNGIDRSAASADGNPSAADATH